MNATNALEDELAKLQLRPLKRSLKSSHCRSSFADLKLQFIEVVELLPTEKLKNNREARNTKLAALKLRARYKEELAEVGGDPWELLQRKQAEVQTGQGAAADANRLLKAALARESRRLTKGAAKVCKVKAVLEQKDKLKAARVRHVCALIVCSCA